MRFKEHTPRYFEYWLLLAAALLSSGCVDVEKTAAVAMLTETSAPTATTTYNPTETQFVLPTLTPTFEPTRTPEPTPIPFENLYLDILPDMENLDLSSGPISWEQPVTLIIPPNANLIDGTEFIQQINPMPVTWQKDWEQLAPITTEFNKYWEHGYDVMAFVSNISRHPFLQGHSITYQGKPLLFEYMRVAHDIEQSQGKNPLLGQSWVFEQQSKDGKVRRSTYKFIHFKNMTAEEYGSQLFRAYPDDETPMFTSLSDVNINESSEIAIRRQQPHQLTLAACNLGSAYIGTLELVSVEEVFD